MTAEDRASQRNSWGIPHDAVVIGSVGRLVPHKRNDFVLQVFAALRKSSHADELWCVIAGKGPDLERLRQIAGDLEIGDRVRFPGWQPSVSRAWSAVDLFLMPSDDEGLGLTIIEAIACGCMAMPAANGGMIEILNKELAKYCIGERSVATWASLTQGYLDLHPTDRAKLIRRAQSAVREKFDANTQWAHYVNWLEKHGK